jgi:hypothetical protein
VISIALHGLQSPAVWGLLLTILLTKAASAAFVEASVMVEMFIAQKSQQLVFFVSRYLRGQLPHAELHLFIWDTLEEWAQLRVGIQEPQTFHEQVFWHVLHQLEYWPESRLQHDKLLRKQLHQCLGFLRGKAEVPIDCVGIRP